MNGALLCQKVIIVIFYPGSKFVIYLFSDAFDISKNILSYGKVRVGVKKQVEMLIHIELIIHLKRDGFFLMDLQWVIISFQWITWFYS